MSSFKPGPVYTGSTVLRSKAMALYGKTALELYKEIAVCPPEVFPPYNASSAVLVPFDSHLLQAASVKILSI